MSNQKKKILELYKNGLKAKEISEKISVEYETIQKIIKNEQGRIRRLKNPQKYRDSANRRYPKYAKKTIIRSKKTYEKNAEEISNKTKEFRKTPEGQIYFRAKRQKEKEKDPEGFKEKKNANWAKNYPKNKDRLSKKNKKDRLEKKQIVVKHYSNGKSNCNCCGYTGIDFLTIDHIIPKKEMEKDPEMIKIGFKAKRKAHKLIQWVITKNFPKGFQILCWNCNSAKFFLGKCPHQK